MTSYVPVFSFFVDDDTFFVPTLLNSLSKECLKGDPAHTTMWRDTLWKHVRAFRGVRLRVVIQPSASIRTFPPEDWNHCGGRKRGGGSGGRE